MDEKILKPRHGTSCNNCGECCKDVLCVSAVHVFKRTEGPCPAIQKKENKFMCGLMMQPENYVPDLVMANGKEVIAKAIGILVGAGIGCDSLLVGEKADDRFRAQFRNYIFSHREDIDAALNLVGIK